MSDSEGISEMLGRTILPVLPSNLSKSDGKSVLSLPTTDRSRPTLSIIECLDDL
ncbi:hypothetical protein [Haladaptatus sp. R4]|uniref:hypothetical protein n=1 Tax=Haladaptatus sp. R4 TaxID=1679489 RepID=UPI000ABEA4F4|nr:hypothetical protein [Haladaptatus sp. R4]